MRSLLSIRTFAIVTIVWIATTIPCTASTETESQFVPVDHWSVKAVKYLYEQGLCDDWAESAVKVDENMQMIPKRIIAKLTMEAYFRAKMRIVDRQDIKPVCWLILEGLAAQYAKAISDINFKPEDMVAFSRMRLKDHSLPKTDSGPFPDIPEGYWVMEGYKLFFTKTGYPDWGGRGRTLTKYETAMLILRASTEDKKHVDSGAVLDAGMLVMYESALNELEVEVRNLEAIDNSVVWNDWVRSQPEYPGDLTGGNE